MSDPKVITITPHLSQLEAPVELRELQAWICWRYEQIEGEPKPRKVPMYADGGRRYGKQGAPEDRAKLVGFAAARSAAARRGFDGVGVALLPEWGITALDFDNVVDADGKLPAEVEDIVSRTFAEYSPSGKGVRAFVKGNLGDHKSFKNDENPYTFEVFSSKGFVTFTGNPLLSTEVLGLENTISPVDHRVIALCDKRFGAMRGVQTSDPDDAFDRSMREQPIGLKSTEIAELLADLDASMGREGWIKVGMAIHHETEGEGFELWDEWSQGGYQYPGPDVLQAQWESFTRRNSAKQPVTMATVKKMAQEARSRRAEGLAPPESISKAVDRAKASLTSDGDPAVVSTPEDFKGPYPIISAGEFSLRPAPPWIIKGLLPRADLGVLFGASGSGKAQPLDEKVLTPRGWTTMGDLKVGSQVIGSAGLPVSVLGVYPQGLKDEWEVTFSNGAVVRCCGEHLWAVRKGGINAFRVMTTEQVAKKPKKTHWHIPLCAPISYASSGNPLPINPYLLGALLGDGGITAYVGFTSADEEIVEQVRNSLPDGHILLKKSSGDYAYQITSRLGQPNQVWNALRFLGLAGKKSETKFVPEEYMYASPADRLALLQGLMDTDGFVSDGGGRTCEFACASRSLTEAVSDLVMSLGGHAKAIVTKKTTHLDSYKVSFRMGFGVNPFRLSRKAKRCAFIGNILTTRIFDVRKTGRQVEMQCIKVSAPDSLYVTNGYVLTHNTFIALDLAFAIARGIDWRGRKTIQGRVLYLAAEGGGGVSARILAYAQHNSVDPKELPLGIMHSIPNFLHEEDVGNVAAAITSARGVDLVIVDTFAQVTSGANENSGEDMGKALRHARAIKDATGAMVLLVHHSGKDTSKGARGWSGIRAAADVELEVWRPEEGDTRVLRTSKQKDGADDLSWGFTLDTVQVGVDEDGDAITSLVVVEAEMPVFTSDEPSPAKVAASRSAWEQTIVDVYEGRDRSQPLLVRDLLDKAVLAVPAPAEGEHDYRLDKLTKVFSDLTSGRGKIFTVDRGCVYSDEFPT